MLPVGTGQQSVLRVSNDLLLRVAGDQVVGMGMEEKKMMMNRKHQVRELWPEQACSNFYTGPYSLCGVLVTN